MPWCLEKDSKATDSTNIHELKKHYSDYPYVQINTKEREFDFHTLFARSWNVPILQNSTREVNYLFVHFAEIDGQPKMRCRVGRFSCMVLIALV